MLGRRFRSGRIAGIASLTGVPVGDVMSREPIAMPIDLPARAARAFFSEFRHVSFPVTDPVGWPVGMLRLDALEHVTGEQHCWATVAELADTDPGLVAAEDDEVTSLIARPAFRRVGRAAVIGRDGRLVGIVSVGDLERVIRARRISAQAAPPRNLARSR